MLGWFEVNTQAGLGKSCNPSQGEKNSYHVRAASLAGRSGPGTMIRWRDLKRDVIGERREIGRIAKVSSLVSEPGRVLRSVGATIPMGSGGSRKIPEALSQTKATGSRL
jgi:hypothetical protein